MASALRGADIFVFVQNETYAQFYGSMVNAMGGLRLWVPDDEAEAARAFIAEHRTQPSTLAPLTAPEATVRTILSLFLTIMTGVFLPLRPRRPARLGDGQPAD